MNHIESVLIRLVFSNAGWDAAYRLELVGEGLAGGDRTLGNTRNTIVLSVVQLTNPVPVDRCSVDLHVVGHMNDQIVSPVSDDCWAWRSAIECQNITLVSIWCSGYILN